jgi:hydroxymethylbilane synthase
MPDTAPLLRIASRASPLAMAQSHNARAQLARLHGWPQDAWDAIYPIIPMKTTGDRVLDRPLADIGGKGLFVKEIEEALLENRADIAVHSMKDLPGLLPPDLVIAAVLERENPADVFIGPKGGFASLPQGATLGTSSPRRRAQALRQRPDLNIIALRGNVETRLAKLARGEADGIMLAQAGLTRLGIAPDNIQPLTGDAWLPAICQGAVGLEIRANDDKTRALVAPLDHGPSALNAFCERGFLAYLEGSCRTPIAGLARITENHLDFLGEVLSPDGRRFWRVARNLTLSKPGANGRETVYALGRDAAADIRAQAGGEYPNI